MVWSGRERYGQVEKGNRFNSNTYTHDVIVLEYHAVWYGQVDKGMVKWRKVIGLIAIHTHTML